MTTDNVWRTVKDHGAPDPDEHEWVLWRRAGDPTALWRPAQAQHIQDEPMYDWDNGEWAPFTPPSAPAPPKRWTIDGPWAQTGTVILHDHRTVTYGEVVDALNAADRPDTGDGFDVAGLRAWAQDYADACNRDDEFERGERAAYLAVVRKIDSGKFGTVTADPPPITVDEADLLAEIIDRYAVSYPVPIAGRGIDRYAVSYPVPIAGRGRANKARAIVDRLTGPAVPTVEADDE